MNRFYWGDQAATLGEDHITQQTGVALYDGENKVCINLSIFFLTDLVYRM